MRFRVLGPLRIEVGCRLVSVTSPKQRAVLAVLLLHAGRYVPVAELVDQVWGARCPVSARSLAQTYIWRLRRLLGEHEPSGQHARIIHGPAGYMMRVAEGELDAVVFEQLVCAGLSSLAAADAARASVQLRDALALWSGEPLCELDLAGPAAARCSRLAEFGRQALRARIEADLILGRHALVAAELRPLIAEDPLDEQLHAYLMAALAQSGRRADALHAYAQARHLLTTELGLEPGLRLRQLQTAILRGDNPVIPMAV